MRPLLLLLLSSSISLGQLTLAAPPANHPDLYYAFFTKRQPSLITSGVNAPDAAKLSSVSTLVADDLRSLDQNLQAYLAQSKTKAQQPKATTLQAFDAARALASLRGAQKLRQSVSPQGWQQFQTWINGAFRTSPAAAYTR
jgi:hypothetical protein